MINICIVLLYLFQCIVLLTDMFGLCYGQIKEKILC